MHDGLVKLSRKKARILVVPVEMDVPHSGPLCCVWKCAERWWFARRKTRPGAEIVGRRLEAEKSRMDDGDTVDLAVLSVASYNTVHPRQSMRWIEERYDAHERRQKGLDMPDVGERAMRRVVTQ